MKSFCNRSLLLITFVVASMLMQTKAQELNYSIGGEKMTYKDPRTVTSVASSIELWLNRPTIRLNGQKFTTNAASTSFNIMLGTRGALRAGLMGTYLNFSEPYQTPKNSQFSRNYHSWKIGPSIATETNFWSNKTGEQTLSTNLQLGAGYTRLKMTTDATDEQKNIYQDILSQKKLNGWFIDCAFQLKFSNSCFSVGLGYFYQWMSYKGNFAGLPTTNSSRAKMSAHGPLMTISIRALYAK